MKPKPQKSCQNVLCKTHRKSIDVSNTLSDITAKLDEIKNIVDNRKIQLLILIRKLSLMH